MSKSQLPSPEYIEARKAIERLPESLDSVDAILAELRGLESVRDRFRDEYVVLGPDGPITWVNHESLAWALGESVRQTLRKHRRLRNDARLWDTIERVAADPAVGKGREPFVMLLGQYGGRSRSALLLRLLDDHQIVGHALYALRLLGVPDAETQARTLLTHRRSWVRSEAKKYLKKIGAAA